MGDGVMNDEVWKELLEEFDANKDGKVYFFEKIMKTLLIFQ